MAFLTQIFPVLSQWLKVQKCEDVPSCSGDATSACKVLKAICNAGPNKVIISGPDRADKTAMAFQAAVTAAAVGSKVVYICTHPISRLPVPVHGMKCPDPSTMRNVDFLYFEDCKELIAWLASVHTKKKLPGCIVIEDILTYASQVNETNIEMGLAKLCALIANSSSWISHHNETGSCGVLMTAPSRIASLDFVFSQFDFKMAQYKGPSSDDPYSHLSYQWKNGKIDISFHKANDCLIIQDVFASQIT